MPLQPQVIRNVSSSFPELIQAGLQTNIIATLTPCATGITEQLVRELSVAQADVAEVVGRRLADPAAIAAALERALPSFAVAMPASVAQAAISGIASALPGVVPGAAAYAVGRALDGATSELTDEVFRGVAEVFAGNGSITEPLKALLDTDGSASVRSGSAVLGVTLGARRALQSTDIVPGGGIPSAVLSGVWGLINGTLRNTNAVVDAVVGLVDTQLHQVWPPRWPWRALPSGHGQACA